MYVFRILDILPIIKDFYTDTLQGAESVIREHTDPVTGVKLVHFELIQQGKGLHKLLLPRPIREVITHISP